MGLASYFQRETNISLADKNLPAKGQPAVSAMDRAIRTNVLSLIRVAAGTVLKAR